MNDYIYDILKEYIIENQIPSNENGLTAAYDYIVQQGYADSICLVCDALIADRKITELLTAKH